MCQFQLLQCVQCMNQTSEKMHSLEFRENMNKAYAHALCTDTCTLYIQCLGRAENGRTHIALGENLS